MDYFFINIGAVLIPFLFSFHPKLKFYLHWKSVFSSIAISMIPFVIWDIYFTKIEVWGFNPEHLMGVYLVNLPIEEVLFFICIPYACLFTYHCLGLFWEKYNFKSLSAVMVYLLMLISLVGILFHYDKAYTLWTSVVLFSVLFVQKFVLKSNWLGTFFMVYFVLLIPFIIVNGLLTGSFYDQPIVWYNNGDNLGVRIGTIPMEDVFYGLQLILINVSIYEGFKRIYKTEKS